MVRKIRKISQTGYYHVMSRGNNKQIIFRDEKDRLKYLSCIKDALKKHDVKLICYCLMTNHTHLVIYDEDNQLSLFMLTLNSKYASYFNKKYNRVGYLFQDRFKSECIVDERQLLAAYRYVLNNPYKAGLCKPWDYKWNSYACFQKPSSIVDINIISDLIIDEKQHKDFISSYADDHFIDID